MKSAINFVLHSELVKTNAGNAGGNASARGRLLSDWHDLIMGKDKT